MESQNSSERNREKMSRIFDASTPGAGGWRSDELGAVLGAQLAAPLVDDLAGFGGGNRDEIEALALSVVPAIHTFRNLLFHPTPPVKLLVMVKDFAKASRLEPEGPLHIEVATALYYIAIFVALKRHGVRITEMNDTSLSEGVAWVTGRSWMDQEVKSLLGNFSRA